MQPMQITFMALLLAHLLGDFLLQPKWIIRNKDKSFWPLICHGITHGIIAWICLLVFAQVTFLSILSQVVVIGYVAVHLLIDNIKFRLIARHNLLDNWKTFLFDQSLHLIILAITAFIITGSHLAEFIQSIRLSALVKTYILEVVIIYVAVVFGGGYLIRYLTKGLAKDIVDEASAHLENAGLYVGWIERLLVITAIAMQSPALVGLILTGKSIVRFPEFKEARFAEYFLIGTLLSISLSVLGGIVLLWLLYGTVSLK
jgi:hypothetical protein